MPQRQAGHRHVWLLAGFDQSLLAGRIITPPAVAQHADDLKPQWVRWIAHHWCPLPRWWTPSLAYLIRAYYVLPIERLRLIVLGLWQCLMPRHGLQCWGLGCSQLLWPTCC